MVKEKRKIEGKEPVFIVKPALKNYGLDYLHISLIALVIILVGLAFSLAYFKQPVVLQSCANGIVNGTCAMPKHNASQALLAAEKTLASYATLNTSLSLLPYYSFVNRSSVYYLGNQSEWLVNVPYLYPYSTNAIYNISLVLYDSNLSLAAPLIQTIKPVFATNNSVTAFGAVSIYGTVKCANSKPIPVYLITDPYAPGMINSLLTAINTSKQYGSAINISYYFIFSSFSLSNYKSSGIQQTQYLGQYLSCASNQNGFPAFLKNLSIAYSGRPLTNLTLYQVAASSGLNFSSFNSCMGNVVSSLNRQAQLAALYSVPTTPEFVVNCKYATIPQTLNAAINYSLNTLGK